MVGNEVCQWQVGQRLMEISVRCALSGRRRGAKVDKLGILCRC